MLFRENESLIGRERERASLSRGDRGRIRSKDRGMEEEMEREIN
jgi:hypothetical protein